MTKTALIGHGYWGKNIARTLHSIGREPALVFDADTEKSDKACELYGCCPAKSFDEILTSDVNAVFIATPPSTHYELAKACLLAGKHVFVEKPFTTSLEDALDLLDIAKRQKLWAIVDHVFLYAEPVKYLKRLIDQKAFGDIVYINCRRINLGLFQHSVDVIWDLAVHDLSIIDYLFGLDIKNVNVVKNRYKDFPRDAVANINFELASGTIVNINVSWLSPFKVREMIIGGTEKMALYDDTRENKIQIHDSGVIIEGSMDDEALYNQLIQYRVGDIHEPVLPKTMPLEESIKGFFSVIENGGRPVSGSRSIKNVMKALEIISRSYR